MVSAYRASMVNVPDLKNVNIFVHGTGLPFTNTTLLGDVSSPVSDSGAEPFHDRAMGNGKES